MNIGIFTDTYHPQINGVVTSALMLERELGKLGHKVYVFTTTDPNVKTKSPRVFRLPSMPLIFLKTHRLTFFYPPKLIVRVKKFKLDIVHTYSEFPLGFFGKLISFVYRIPMIHTYHTMYEDYVHYVANGHLITQNGAKRFSRVFCNYARAVVAPAEKTRKYLLEIGVKRPIRMIPTGLDFGPFDPLNYPTEERDAARREFGLNDSDKIIITVGRVAKEKSMDVLVGMMPALLKSEPKAILLIIGDGPARELLSQQADLLGVGRSVIFAGFRPWEEIGKYYRMADIFMTASTSETQGLTYIEAMASRIPVVVKNDPSFANVIRDGETGYLFENDGDAASAAARALANIDEARNAADRGFDTIQSFSAQTFAKRVEDLYMEYARR